MAILSSCLNLPRNLLDLDDHKLRWLQRGKPDNDVNDAEVNVRLGGRLFVTLYEISVTWCLTLKGSLTKEILHESADFEGNLGPQRLVVWLKDNPFGTPVK